MCNSFRLSPLNGELKIIDYEKLKLAHDLAEKLLYASDYDSVSLIVGVVKEYKEVEYSLVINCERKTSSFNIDYLIAKLQELTTSKAEPKYKLWQEVYFLSEGEIDESKVYEIDDSHTPYFYQLELCGAWWREDQLYSSKEELIDAQIEYWKSMKDQFVDKNEIVCEHESDGRFHGKTPIGHSSSSIPGSLPAGCKHVNKCKKCGEFY